MESEFTIKLSKKLNEQSLFPIGCADEEIKHLENYAKLPLPETYKEFLGLMGRGIGGFFTEINIFYPQVFDNRNAMKELLEEDKSNFDIDETDFVFSSYQGFQFMYFNLSEGNDPPICHYIEGAKVPTKKFDRFTEYIIKIFEEAFGQTTN